MSELACISIGLITTGIITLIISLKKRLLLSSIFQFTVIILIYGQSLWLSSQFDLYNSLRLIIGYNEVYYTDSIFVGYLFALFQLGLSLLVFMSKAFNAPYRNRAFTNKINVFYENLILLFIALLIPIAMVVNGGGMSFFYNPGSMLAGQTLLLLLAGILKWSLLSRIMFGMPLTFISKICFALYLLMALFTSRFMTIFALFQLMIFLHYFSSPIKFKGLIKYGLSGFFIIIVFGVFRDIASNNDVTESNWSDIISLMLDFSNFFINWFYTLNTEIFVGVCNAVYEIKNHQSVDYLLSELAFVISYFPNSIKTDPNFVVNELNEFLSENSARSSSVIASGFERYYFGIGVFGFILYSLILLGVLWLFESKLGQARYSKSAIFSIQAINGIRGSMLGVISFFGIADLIAFYIFRLIIRTNKIS